MTVHLRAVGTSHLCRDAVVLPNCRWTYVSASVLRRHEQRHLHTHLRTRSLLSRIWVPTRQTARKRDEGTDVPTRLLADAGFLRQAHAGLFHFLPLGLRVQRKIERLIDKHMLKLGASKVSLSSITTQEMWQLSGRWENSRPELYQVFSDAGFTGQLLSPTHEEEITRLASSAIQSYRDLPLRLYQISRKYRNERRPRQGLLRAREFLMKDLYTFDIDEEAGLETYKSVKTAYDDFFTELGIPYLVAEADSGNMGGNLSHEFHYASPAGEDKVITCNSCAYVSNEEKFESNIDASAESSRPVHPSEQVMMWSSTTAGPKPEIVYAFYPSGSISLHGLPMNQLNPLAVKRQIPSVNLSATHPPTPLRSQTNVPAHASTPHSMPIVAIFDHRLTPDQRLAAVAHIQSILPNADSTSADEGPQLTIHDARVDLIAPQSGDPCPRCPTGTIDLHTAIELGHTFHLGRKYTAPLRIAVQGAESSASPHVPVMGCHGIGVSRLVGAVAGLLADSRGLNWPVAISPFEAVVIPAAALLEQGYAVYDALVSAGIDAVLDDRAAAVGKRMSWMLKDADLVGYPVIVVVGQAWERGKCEVQCRQLDGKAKTEVDIDDIPMAVENLLDKLRGSRAEPVRQALDHA